MGEIPSKINNFNQRVFSKNTSNDYYTNEINETFYDMEEIEGDIYVGNGIKRMKAYKCDLTIDELNKRKEKFWNTVTDCNNNKNWKNWNIIRRAITYDEVRGSILLNEYDIKCKNGCIDNLIDKEGNEYKVPNYCINEPYFERELGKEDIKDDINNIIFYGNYKGDIFNFDFTVSNKLTGKELKNIIKNKRELDINTNIRLFENGFEIKDEDYLYQHKLNNNSNVHLVIN
jgi:hypothetical protein